MDEKKTVVSPPKKGTSKRNKKKGVIAIVLVMALVIGATLAYLGTRSNDKENIFTGSQDIDLTLTEPKWKDKQKDDDENEIYDKTEEERAADYSPGGLYLKNPKLFNSSDNSATEWVAMKVSFKIEDATTCYKKIKQADGTWKYLMTTDEYEKESDTSTKKEFTRSDVDDNELTTPWESILTDEEKEDGVVLEPVMNLTDYATIKKLIKPLVFDSEWTLLCTSSDASGNTITYDNLDDDKEDIGDSDEWAIFIYNKALKQNQSYPTDGSGKDITDINDPKLAVYDSFSTDSATTELFSQIQILTQKEIATYYKEQNPKNPNATSYPYVNVYLPDFEIVLEGAGIKNESTYLKSGSYVSVENLSDATDDDIDNIKKELIGLFGYTVN